MPASELATPTTASLFRIGRNPDPLAWTPWAYVGEGRFDDPEADSRRKRYRVLYAGDRRACFLETLADFRPGLDGAIRAEFRRDWLETRRIGEFVLDDPEKRRRWLDLRPPEPHQVLRRDLGPLLLDHGMTDFDISTATCEQAALTQRIGAWCFDQGFAGISYMSRLDYSRTCWAIFERSGSEAVSIRPVSIRPIDDNDPDLRAVAALFGLPWPALS